MKERNESGLTIKAYCNSIGIHENTYYYWLKKLRKSTHEGLAEIAVKTNGMSKAEFAEVKLPERPALTQSRCTPQRHIIVETAGVRVTADAEYPTDKLVELLRVVICTC
jgi:transposase-like protein